MNVVVRVPTPLRTYVDGNAKLDVDLEGGATVGDLLDRLATEWPALERRIRDERRTLRQHVNVFVGADNVRDLDRLATVIPAGAELVVLPAVSGG